MDLECVTMTHKKVPTYLTDEQRQVMMEIPTDLSDRDLACYYTLTSEELELVNRRRRPANRFGFAVQLALLLFLVALWPSIETRSRSYDLS